MPKFETKQSELNIEVRFAAPAFALLAQDSSKLHSGIFDVLGKFGLTTNDITIESAPAALGAKSITYSANLIGLVVKLHLSKVEFICWDLKRLTQIDGIAIFIGVMEVVAKVVPGLEAEGFYTTLSMHASISGQNAAQFINARIGKELDGLGLSTGHALAYYFGEKGSRQRLVLVLDGSAIHLDALFLRQSADFSGKAMNFRDMPDALVSTFDDSLKALGLEADKK